MVEIDRASPRALACGGTTLYAESGPITREVVWHQFDTGNGATGGGVSNSEVFVLPAWQAHLGIPSYGNGRGRGVPDVAANADPCTGYEELGEPLGYVNPLFAIRAQFARLSLHYTG